MITVAGASLDPDFSGTFSAGSVEAQVLGVMRDSNSKYAYDSLQQLTFELQLRREIVNAAKQLYKSRMGFAVFNRSRCNEDYWDRTPNGGFRLKRDAVPAAAIRDIYDNGSAYATECATAMQVVYYKAFLEVFGEERFNSLFKDIYLMNWHTSDPLLKAASTPRPVPELLLGDRGYFANPDVDPQTPQWQGENVIVLPDGLYYGHGVGIYTADRIIQALNGNRRDGSTKTAYLMESAGRPDIKKLASYYRPA